MCVSRLYALSLHYDTYYLHMHAVRGITGAKSVPVDSAPAGQYRAVTFHTFDDAHYYSGRMF